MHIDVSSTVAHCDMGLLSIWLVVVMDQGRGMPNLTPGRAQSCALHLM